MSTQDMDKQIARIQQSTRTVFRPFVGVHNRLRLKYSWYYRWHLWRGANLVHLIFLFVYMIGLGLAAYSFGFLSYKTINPIPVKASADYVVSGLTDMAAGANGDYTATAYTYNGKTFYSNGNGWGMGYSSMYVPYWTIDSYGGGDPAGSFFETGGCYGGNSTDPLTASGAWNAMWPFGTPQVDAGGPPAYDISGQVTLDGAGLDGVTMTASAAGQTDIVAETATLPGSDVAPHDCSNDICGVSTVISASMEDNPGLLAYHAFDGGFGSGQYWAAHATTGWLKIDLGSGNETALASYGISANTIPEPTRMPKDWTFQGSNDDTNWTTLDTVSGETSWGSGETRTYNSDNTSTAYRYYKVDVTLNNGADYLVIAELYLNSAGQSGVYTLPNALVDTWTVTPSLAGYTFDPASREVVITDADVTAQNFTATASATGITISGTCKQYDESTNCANSETVKVAVNGTLQAQTGTTSSGTWSIADVTAPASGDTVTVFVDGVADANEANAVTKYDGTGDITGVNLFEKHLSLGSEDNQTLSNNDISKYDNSVSGDEDIFFDVDGSNNLTLPAAATQTDADQKLITKASNTYRPASAGGVRSTLPILTIPTSAIVTLDSNTLELTGVGTPLSIVGTFNVNTSTIEYSGATATNVVAITYNNLYIDQAGTTFTAAGDFTVSSVLTINAGTFDASSRTITLSGSGTPFVVTGTFTKSTSTIKYTGSSATNVAAAAYTNLYFDYSGTTFSAAGTISVSGTLTTTAGSVYNNSGQTLTVGTLSNLGKVQFQGGETITITNKDTTHGTIEYNGTGNYSGVDLIYGTAYYNLTFSGAGGQWLESQTSSVGGDLHLSAGTFNQGSNNRLLTVTGTTYVDGGAYVIPNLGNYYSKLQTSGLTISSGTLWSGNFSTTTVTGNLTVSGGTFTYAGWTTLQVAGTCNMSAGTLTPPSTLTLNGNSASFTPNSATYNTVRAAKTAGQTLTLAGNFTASGFYVDSGSLNAGTTRVTISNNATAGLSTNGQALYDLTLSGLAPAVTGNSVVSHNVTFSGANNSISNGITLTVQSSATTTIDSGKTVAGAGTLVLVDGAGANLANSGTLAVTTRFETSTSNATVPAGTYGRIQAYNSSASNRSVILGTAAGQTVNITGNVPQNINGFLQITNEGAGNLTFDGATNNPTVNIYSRPSDTTDKGRIYFSGSGGGAKTLAAGSGTWSVAGDVNFTGGLLTAGNSTFNLNGSVGGQTVTSASQSFKNLTIANTHANGVTFADAATTTGTFADTTGSTKITFLSGATYNFNTINIVGTSGHLITLAPSGATNWIINPTTVTSVSYVDVTKSTNTGTSFCATYSTGTDNVGWLIGAAGSCQTVAPTNVAISGIDSTYFDVTWTDSSSDETGFKVYISTTPNATCSLATYPADPDYTTAAGATSQHVTGKSINTQYCAKVIATGPSGDSDPAYATAAKYTLANTPSAPTVAGDYDDADGYYALVTNNANNNPAGTQYWLQYSTNGTDYSDPAGMSWFDFTPYYKLTGLDPNTQYWFKVKAKNGDNVETSYSTAGADVTPPAAPTGLNTSNICSTTASTSWIASTGADKYTFSYGTDVNATNLGTTADIVDTSHNLSSLDDGETYYWKVLAVSNTNGTGAYSAIDDFTTSACEAPIAPSDFNGTPASATQINWTWGNTAGETGWKVQDTDHTTLVTLPADTLSWNETPLSVNTAYTRHVNVYNDYGANDSNQKTVYTLANVPSAPTLSAVASGIKIVINKNSNPDANTRYAIYNDTAAKYVKHADGTLQTDPDWQLYADWGGASGFVNTGLDPNVSYTYKVKAENGDNTATDFSATANAYSPANVPSAPTVTADYSVEDGLHIDATINPNSNPAGTNYWIQYSINGTDYSDPAGMAWQTETSYILANLNPNQNYYLKVKAKNVNNAETAYSAAANKYTFANVPSAPTLVPGYSALEGLKITVTINPNSNPAGTNYWVRYSTDGITFSDPASMAWQTSTTYVFNKDADNNSLSPNAQYYIKVKAENGDSVGTDYSDAANKYTLANVPSAPTLSATATGIKIVINKNSNPDANTRYAIYNDTAAKYVKHADGTLQTDPDWQLYADWGGASGFVNTGLDPNVSYTYKVKAENGDNTATDFSATANAYSPANVPSAPTVSMVSASEIKIVVNKNSNPDANTRYAIYNDTAAKYVKHADGTLQTDPDWQLYADWGGASGFVNTGLDGGTNYAYKVKAENGDNFATVLSDSAATNTEYPSVGFSSATAQASISHAANTVTIQLANISGTDASVDYAATGGTAVRDTDYTFTDGTASINHGDTTATAELTLINNHLVGSNKTIVFTLSNPVNTSLGAIDTLTFTIVNDNVGPSGSFTINSGGARTNNRDLTLHLSYNLATEVIASKNADFAGASYEAVASSITYTLPDLDGAYNIYLKYKDQYGNESTAYSHAITLDRVAPNPPTSLAAQAGRTSVSLSWTKPSDPYFAKSKVYRGDIPNFTLIQATKTYVINNSTTTTYLDTDVIDNHTYYYKVTAFDDVNNESLPSNEVSAKPDSVNPSTPGKPQLNNKTATIDDRDFVNNSVVKLDWSASTDVNSGFKAYYVTIGHISGGSDVYDQTEVLANNISLTLADGIYYVRVLAKDKAGNSSSYSEEYSFGVDTTAPTAPANVVMFDVSNRSTEVYAAMVSWQCSTDEVSGLKGYIISRNGTDIINDQGITDNVLVEENSKTCSYLDLATADATVSYAIKAKDKIDNTSEAANATIAATSLAQLTGQENGGTSLKLPATVIGEGELIISEIKAEPSKLVGDSTQAVIKWQTGVPATSLVEYGESNELNLKTKLDTGLNSSHTVVLSDLKPNTVYSFKVVSQDKYNKEAMSANQTFTTYKKNEQKSVLEIIVQNIVNAFSRVYTSVKKVFSSIQPRNVFAQTEIKDLTVVDVSTADKPGYALYWPGNLGQVSVERSEANGGFSTIANISQNFYLDYDVQTGNSYSYRVGNLTATSANTLGGKSVISNINIQPGVSDAEFTSVIVSFKTDKLAKSQVLYGEGGVIDKQTSLDNSLNQSHTILIEKLKPKTTYSFKLKATDETGGQVTETNIQNFVTADSTKNKSIFEIIIQALVQSFSSFNRWIIR